MLRIFLLRAIPSKHCATIDDFERLVKSKRPDLVITQSVFSMAGSIAPVEEILKLTKDQESALIIDDAHVIGVLGENGAGICVLKDSAVR